MSDDRKELLPPRAPFLRSLIMRRGAVATFIVLALTMADGWRNFSTIRAVTVDAATLLGSYAKQRDEARANEQAILALLNGIAHRLDQAQVIGGQCRSQIEKFRHEFSSALKTKTVCRIDDSYRPIGNIAR